VKDVDDDVRTIRWSLSEKQSLCNFRPLGIAREHEEKIETVVVLCKCNGILKSLVHVARTACVR
jgi:hypothetical protein